MIKSYAIKTKNKLLPLPLASLDLQGFFIAQNYRNTTVTVRTVTRYGIAVTVYAPPTIRPKSISI
ncbi:hypothetical protein LU276_05930 [Moraxella haemolytica]|uniref:hypothetical protein n=1 Tax=Moraxella haemolytica TaxID=2904119 RepID=UPI002543CCEA|nr:hypothetical protein [Moraxella sp. ZY171148]WII94570.1 hypothetical protein LU276_05930 [Moraxella sp. ZY171148]